MNDGWTHVTSVFCGAVHILAFQQQPPTSESMTWVRSIPYRKETNIANIQLVANNGFVSFLFDIDIDIESNNGVILAIR